MMPAPTAPAADIPPPRGLTRLMVLTAFAVAGTIHYQSPSLAEITAELRIDAATAGWIPTLSFGGMLLGIMFLVPLGDRIDKRTLILGKLVVLIVAQAVMTVAPSMPLFAAASLVTGICCSLAQSLIAIAAEVARPGERGRAVGTVLTGLFVGILFSRIAGGLIAAHFHWRLCYVLSTAMLLVFLPVLAARLPSTRPTTNVRYPALLASVLALLRERADVRRVAAIQFLLGVCYGGFWAVVAPMLALFHRVGPTGAGLIGIPGAAGILIARPAGRWTDRAGSIPVVTTGIGLVLAAWATFGFSAWSIVAVILGAILLDCGLRTSMVANQTLVNTVLPEARARANTLFGMHVWGGNAAGAWLTSVMLAHSGWTAVCATTVAASAIALLVHLLGTRSGSARERS